MSHFEPSQLRFTCGLASLPLHLDEHKIYIESLLVVFVLVQYWMDGDAMLLWRSLLGLRLSMTNHEHYYEILFRFRIGRRSCVLFFSGRWLSALLLYRTSNIHRSHKQRNGRNNYHDDQKDPKPYLKKGDVDGEINNDLSLISQTFGLLVLQVPLPPQDNSDSEKLFLQNEWIVLVPPPSPSSSHS